MFKNKIQVIIVLLFISISAHAQTGTVTIGAKYGETIINESGFTDDKALGIQLSYELSRTWSIELEHLKGETTVLYFYETIDISTLAIYGTFRTPRRGYFMVKAGVLNEDIQGFGDDTGLSAGLGGGFRFNNRLSIEGEFTVVEQDVNFVGVTARYSF